MYVLVTIGKPLIVQEQRVMDVGVTRLSWMMMFTPAFTILTSFSFILVYHTCQKAGTYLLSFLFLCIIAFFFFLKCFIQSFCRVILVIFFPQTQKMLLICLILHCCCVHLCRKEIASSSEKIEYQTTIKAKYGNQGSLHNFDLCFCTLCVTFTGR